MRCTFGSITKCLRHLSALSDSTYWGVGVWIEAGKWNEKWMAKSFCFFAVPSMSSIQRDKEFSKASEPCNHDICLCASNLATVPSCFEESNRTEFSEIPRRAPFPNSKSCTGEGRCIHTLAISHLLWVKVCAKHKFANNPGTHHHFRFTNFFQEKDIWQHSVWTWVFILEIFTLISLSPACTSVEGHFYLKPN